MHKCANCGIPIRWKATVVDGETYCCVGCSHGGPCTCDYEHLTQDNEPTQIVHIRTLKQVRIIIR